MSESDFRFTSQYRLQTKTDYQRVFANGRRFGSKYFVVLTCSNNAGSSRLGLAVAKKNARSAPSRNRIKRVVRESFRLNRHRFPGYDIVFLTRPGIANQDNKQLFEQLEGIWKKLAQ